MKGLSIKPKVFTVHYFYDDVSTSWSKQGAKVYVSNDLRGHIKLLLHRSLFSWQRDILLTDP